MCAAVAISSLPMGKLARNIHFSRTWPLTSIHEQLEFKQGIPRCLFCKWETLHHERHMGRELPLFSQLPPFSQLMRNSILLAQHQQVPPLLHIHPGSAGFLWEHAVMATCLLGCSGEVSSKLLWIRQSELSKSMEACAPNVDPFLKLVTTQKKKMKIVVNAAPQAAQMAQVFHWCCLSNHTDGASFPMEQVFRWCCLSNHTDGASLPVMLSIKSHRWSKFSSDVVYQATQMECKPFQWCLSNHTAELSLPLD